MSTAERPEPPTKALEVKGAPGPEGTPEADGVSKVDKSAAKPGRRGGKVFTGLLTVALLFGGGFWVGTATTDPTGSEEYAALDATAQKAAADRDIYKGKNGALERRIAQVEEQAKLSNDAVAGREAAVKKAEEEVKKRETAATTAEKKQASSTIIDGTWVVGVDIEPGTYKAKSAVGSSCYWGIYTSGSNSEDIITNDIPGGGLPSVTLAAGQDFKSSRCGAWTKQ